MEKTPTVWQIALMILISAFFFFLGRRPVDCRTKLKRNVVGYCKVLVFEKGAPETFLRMLAAKIKRQREIRARMAEIVESEENGGVIDLTGADNDSNEKEEIPTTLKDRSRNSVMLGQCSYCGEPIISEDIENGSVSVCCEQDCESYVCILCSMGTFCMAGNLMEWCPMHRSARNSATKLAARAMKAAFTRAGGRINRTSLEPVLAVLVETLTDVCPCTQCASILRKGIDSYFRVYEKHMAETPKVQAVRRPRKRKVAAVQPAEVVENQKEDCQEDRDGDKTPPVQRKRLKAGNPASDLQITQSDVSGTEK